MLAPSAHRDVPEPLHLLGFSLAGDAMEDVPWHFGTQSGNMFSLAPPDSP